MIELGSFVLDDIIGSGGNGVVWRGKHRRLELPVAVKVLPPRPTRHALHAMKNEVQAVARLHHPHVIAVLESGLVNAQAAKQSQATPRRMEENSPYLVVELASGGDLNALRPPVEWPVVADVLRTLLAALAHAHARGVVHRDLKPANVLLCTDGDVRPGMKLTDFGLALSEKSDDLGGGTPIFMAPEQFEVPALDAGPWTDLYALGCLSYWLTTGKAPFPDGKWRELEHKHKAEPPPALDEDIDAPAGFHDWVARLLEKDPAARFRRAADAAAALAVLDDRPPPPADRLPTGFLDVVRRTRRVRKLATAETVVRTGDDATEPAPPASFDEMIAHARAHAQTEVLPDRTPSSRSPFTSEPNTATRDLGAARPPTTWRHTSGDQLFDPRFVEAGLSLFGMRPQPLIGRVDERDLLWRTLLEVHERKAPRLLLLRGPSGVGKSRLVEWVAHRAEEVGAALVLRASHRANGGRGDGFSGAIARHVALAALPEERARARASDWLTRWARMDGSRPDDLGEDELCGIAGIVDGIFKSREAKDAAIVRFLSAVAKERPLLVWLDDVHWGRQALSLVERVLADAPELRVLFVCTVVDELCDEPLRLLLSALGERDGVSLVDVGPLDDGTHDELCASLLGRAEDGLVDALRRRTEGNPLFAVHVVRDWVQRGLLAVTPTGLSLLPGADAALPDALHELWEQRVVAALSSESARRALEIAAVLGTSVDLVEWEAACNEAALDANVLDDVVDALVAAGLARRSETGFQFVHVLVRSSVERRARDAGRAEDQHAAAAAALRLLWGTETPAAAARIGRHLLSAERPAEALPLLFSAARNALDEGDAVEASSLLADFERARAALRLEDDDARVAPALVLQAAVAEREGRHDDARALADRALAATTNPRLRAEALRVHAESALLLGELDVAGELLSQAHKTSAAAHDRVGVGLALRGLGDVDYWRGDHDAAADLYLRAHEIFEAVGRKHDVAMSLWSLGYVALERGFFEEARRRFEEQRALCRSTRDRLGEANAENALGELHRRRGALDESEQHYRAALRIATKSGLSRRWIFRINLAHVRLARGDVAGALALANELLASPAAKQPMVAAPCYWIRAVDAAHSGDLDGWDRAVESALDIASRTDIVEEDLARAAELAAKAMEPRDAARAGVPRKFAEEKWRAMKKS